MTQDINKVFPCNMIGQKQCQTKCLESVSFKITLISKCILNLFIFKKRSLDISLILQLFCVQHLAVIFIRKEHSYLLKIVRILGSILTWQLARNIAVRMGPLTNALWFNEMLTCYKLLLIYVVIERIKWAIYLIFCDSKGEYLIKIKLHHGKFSTFI